MVGNSRPFHPEQRLWGRPPPPRGRCRARAGPERSRACLRYQRVCAVARELLGNDAVGALYRGWGERCWYIDGEASWATAWPSPPAMPTSGRSSVRSACPPVLLQAVTDRSWDATIRAESEEAFRRTGPDVGTPIITYEPPYGNSLYGPVMSEVPDDDQAVAFYDALRTFADFRGFAELKRTDRVPLDLPLLASGRRRPSDPDRPGADTLPVSVGRSLAGVPAQHAPRPRCDRGGWAWTGTGSSR